MSGEINKLSVLGSTGSIGRQTLELVAANRDRFGIASLVAGGNNQQLLLEQISQFQPEYVAVPDETIAQEIAAHGVGKTVVEGGPKAITTAATLPAVDSVVAGIVGFASLEPVLAAIEAGKNIALCNKECLVAAGELVTNRLRSSTSTVIPVDSEHSSIFQCLADRPDWADTIARIILTASGGPFFRATIAELQRVTPAQAVKHPKWSMGAKISVDSATLMNKGLEVIEARWLFDLPAEKIDVLIHPQSLVHGFVEFLDSTMLACLFNPDMRLPIGYALEHLRTGGASPRLAQNLLSPLDLTDRSLEFYAPDREKFPALSLCYDTLREGGVLPAVLNSANEQAVHSFLRGEISFLGITAVVAETVSSFSNQAADSIESVLFADEYGRRHAKELIAGGASRF